MEVVKSKLMEMKNINIGVGLGSLKFGIYTNDVEEELGNPSEAEKNEDEGENWHYDDYDMSMSFDEDSRLVTIAVSDESYLLEGVSLIGKDVEFVEEQVKSMNLGEAFHEEMSEGEDGGRQQQSRQQRRGGHGGRQDRRPRRDSAEEKKEAKQRWQGERPRPRSRPHRGVALGGRAFAGARRREGKRGL